MKTTFKISGMTCSGCKVIVEDKLSSLDIVEDVEVNLETGEAIIYSKYPIEFSIFKNILPSKYKIISERSNNLELDKSIIKKENKIRKLKPLFIILGYISISSLLLNYENWDSTNFMLDFMGLFYIIFSFFKILDLKGFTVSFKIYDPLAKKVWLYAWFYPFIEALIGLMFLMRVEIQLALVLTITILGITTIGVTQILIKKKSIQCACLGTTLKLPMTEATFIENAIMILMAIILIL